MIRMPRLRRALPLLLGLALPATARAEEARIPLELGVSGGYYTLGELQGGGGGIQALWTPGRHFATGLLLESAVLHASGSVPASAVLPAPGSYDYRVASTTLAAVAQARFPVGPIVPHLQIDIGYHHAGALKRENVGCDIDGPLGVAAAAGAAVRMGDHLAVGARLSTRLPLPGFGCDASAGHWHFDRAPLLGARATIDYRF